MTEEQTTIYVIDDQGVIRFKNLRGESLERGSGESHGVPPLARSSHGSP